jgi:cellulose synthase/poly-beta-1,6-N-acetylglucosamine synthase-like glycosyltransferase
MPSVSVVVPNYNHARFLPRRMESILRQTYQDFELIRLDDCSADNSRAILSQYRDDPRVRIEFNDVNSGSKGDKCRGTGAVGGGGAPARRSSRAFFYRLRLRWRKA